MKKVISLLSLLLVFTSIALAQTPVGIPNQYTGPIKHGIGYNGKFLVGVGNKLWSSDGTISGTNPIHTFAGSFYYGPYCFKEMGGKLYFMAHDSVSGQELWVTDGTSAGTAMVKDIKPGIGESSMSPVNIHSMYPNIIQVMNGRLYFVADDGISGRELWASDGTNAGTVMVKDINPGAAGSVPLPGVTTEDFMVAGNKIYFPADDGSGSGTELWMTDGTAAGTVMVKDIVPGSISSGPNKITAYGNKVVFSVNYYTTQIVRGVYVSDGTAAGTTELLPGAINTFDNAMLGSELYFGAIDSNGDQFLYRTDGTAANTTMLTALANESGVVAGDVGKGLACLTAYNNKLYFRNLQSGSGIELWQSDGTIAGTSMLKDIYPGNYSTRPNSFCVLNNRLYFRTEDSLLLNINYTDGTTAGTMQVPSPLPPYLLSNPFTIRAYMSYPLVPVGSTLYFTNAYDISITIYKLDVPVGVDEVRKVSSVNIYPNPSIGYVLVDVEDAVSIKVTDVQGKVVYNRPVDLYERTHKVNIEQLAAGTYTITTNLKNGDRRYGKFVKE